MRLIKTLLAATALSAMLAGGVYAKTLVYCSEGSPEGFDPGLYESGTTLDVNVATYEGLLKFKLGSTEVEPALAEKWEISKDGLTYTFHLRHGVKWQTTDYFTPTRDFNADDVVYSFQRQIKGTTYLPDTTFAYWGDMSMPDQVADMKKVDDYTVVLTLKTPSAPMLANLAMPFAEVVSEEYADGLAKANNLAQLNDKPVGTGPFTFVDYQKDANIRFKANPDYWGGAPKIDSLVFSIQKDPTARLQSLKAGECDVMAYPNPADVASIKKRRDADRRSGEGPQLRRPLVQHPAEAVRQCRSAQGPRHGDRQEVADRRRLSGPGPDRDERVAADDVELDRRDHQARPL